MTWFDVVAWLVIIVIAWLESQRGFGRALFDFLGGIIGLRLAIFLSEPISDTAPVFAVPESNHAFWLATIFFIFVVLTLVATKYIYETTLISLDYLDPIIGGILGIASGMVVAHCLLRILYTSYGKSEIAKVVLESFMGQELLEFRTYHTVVTALQNLGKW